MHVLYYVSGHGYGHASRSAQVVRALCDLDAGASVTVRTTAPAAFFDGLPRVTVSRPEVSADTGVVEKSPLLIDQDATVRRVLSFLERRDAILEQETAFAATIRPDVVAADISFLAGAVAGRLGVPAVGVSNFTWDWIYEPYLDGRPEARRVLAAIRDDYRRMGTLLRLPFAHETDCFGEVIDVPLVAPRGTRPAGEVLAHLGIDPADPSPRVLLAQRGRMSPESLSAAARAAPEITFLHQNPDGGLPANARRFESDPSITFQDVLGACDAVISKLGYSVVAECVAAGVALLYPPRDFFREDGLSSAGAAPYVRIGTLPADDFTAGRWADPLRELLARPRPAARMRADGAAVAAREIRRRAVPPAE